MLVRGVGFAPVPRAFAGDRPWLRGSNPCVASCGGCSSSSRGELLLSRVVLPVCSDVTGVRKTNCSTRERKVAELGWSAVCRQLERVPCIHLARGLARVSTARGSSWGTRLCVRGHRRL